MASRAASTDDGRFKDGAVAHLARRRPAAADPGELAVGVRRLAELLQAEAPLPAHTPDDAAVALLDRLLPLLGAGGGAPPAAEDAPGQGEAAAPVLAVALGEAADALGVSASTVRRWANTGTLAVHRTSGGHRRVPVSEIRRVRAKHALLARPRVRLVPPPDRPLPALHRALRTDGDRILHAAATALYEGPVVGFFAHQAPAAPVTTWMHSLREAAASGDYEPSDRETERLARRALCEGSGLGEASMFVERCGELAVRVLLRSSPGVDAAQVNGTRRVFAACRYTLLTSAERVA